LITLQTLYLEAFFLQHENLRVDIFRKVDKLCNEFKEGDVSRALMEVMTVMREINFGNLPNEYDASQSQNRPTFKMIRQYIKMELLLLLIRSVRTGNWNLHMSVLEDFAKYFFALDLTNYSGMIALYLTEMANLKHLDPAIWQEFEKGNWVVN